MTINDECFECGACVGVCPKEAITEGTPYKIDPKKCNVCGACVGECSAGAIMDKPLFRNTGKFPPSNGDLIPLYPDSYGFVQSCTKYSELNGGTYAVDFYCQIWDYRGDSGYVMVDPNNSMSLSLESISEKLTSKQEQILRDLLDERDLEFDYGYKKLVHKPHQRVPAGSEYWFINDKMGETSAIDDGAAVGIHADRFRQWNYFRTKKRSLHIGKALRDALKGTSVPRGIWE